jgi:hypothetical protein
VYTPEHVSNQYRGCIGPGNNYYLVKGILKRRFWWNIVEATNEKEMESLNFLWTQLKVNSFYGVQLKSNNAIVELLEEHV